MLSVNAFKEKEAKIISLAIDYNFERLLTKAVYDFLEKRVTKHRVKALKGLTAEERYTLFKLLHRICQNTLTVDE